MVRGVLVRLVVLACFTVMGLLLLGAGLTGLVVSQTCCVPGEAACDAENMCAVLQQPQSDQTSAALGFGVILLAGLLVTGELLWERKKRKAALERKRRIRVA